jgi:hypothetical protein
VVDELTVCAAHPDVGAYARFRAGREAGGDLVVERSHLLAQYLADRQLGAIADDPDAAALALDLPIGSHPQGYEVWADPSMFAPQMSVGAPPDSFFADGQNWGFPPPLPAAMHASGHRLWRHLIERVGRHADILRIDHAMAVESAVVGAGRILRDPGRLRHYPREEILAVIAASAAAAGVTIVGEDLGTVPHEVSEAFDRWDASGMYEEQFHLDDEPLAHIPARTVAGIRTHDMEPIAELVATERHQRLPRNASVGHTGATIERPLGRRRRQMLVRLAHERRLPGDRRPRRPGRRDDARTTCRDGCVDRNCGRADSTGRPPRRSPIPTCTTSTRDPGAPPPRRIRRIRATPTNSTGTSSTRAPTDTCTDDSARNPRRRLPLRRLGTQRPAVAVAGSFDGWEHEHHLVGPSESGVWSGWVDGAGDRRLATCTASRRPSGSVVEKSDPVGIRHRGAPVDRVGDRRPLLRVGRRRVDGVRGARIALDAPMSIYEVHLGSWGRHVTDGKRFPRYDELADPIADHVLAHGFTHVEFSRSWSTPSTGRGATRPPGFFAPTRRYGTPQDLMRMIDRLHQRGIGVILDWVPSHFPNDSHGLARVRRHAPVRARRPAQGYHPDWNSAIFNYGRNEVRSFLVSSAMCWLDRYHVDGLRVDAVASMLYLDYSRNEGEWIPNEFGGRENLDAIVFLRQLNEAVYGEFPDVATIAEESTSWPMVSRPTYIGGLGFGFKWDMGWMHDTLAYFERDPIHRRWHHGEITFRSVYASSENFVLPLSHDEVVHGKGSLLARCPATTGSSSPTCGCCTRCSGRSRARSCCSWARAGDAIGVEPRGHARLVAARRSTGSTRPSRRCTAATATRRHPVGRGRRRRPERVRLAAQGPDR